MNAPHIMSNGKVESLPDGSLRVVDECPDCASAVTWDHVAFTDDGKLLVGHCLCGGKSHAFGIDPRAWVVDANGRRL